MTYLNNTLKTGGQAVVLAILMATTVAAQTAMPTELTTLEDVEFPTLDSVDTDQAIVDSLIGQGYEGIEIARMDDAIIVTAERGGVPTKMLFSPTEGTLLLVDGIVPADSFTTKPASDAPRD